MSEFDSGLTDQEAARIMAGARTRTAPEPADQTRADVVLTEDERVAMADAVLSDLPLGNTEAAAERILADRLAAEVERRMHELNEAHRDEYASLRRRAEAAEATVARVRALADEWGDEWRMAPYAWFGNEIRAALDGERP